jgi:hypothetical protein
MICRDGKPFCAWSLLLLGAGWFLVALFVGEIELLSLLPGPAAPITVGTLTACLLMAYWRSPSLRMRIAEMDLRALIAVHLTRFVGIYFLVLHARGELPGGFAVAAGWGDIVVAIGAVALLLIPGGHKLRWAVLIWNALGLIDILFVVSRAAAFIMTSPDSMSPFTRLPLSFLPTMIVPLIIATHVIIFLRLLRKAEAAPARDQQQALFPL